MIQRLSKKLANAWVESNVIPHEDAEIYEYGLQLIIATGIGIAIIIAFSLICGIPAAWIFYIAAFIPLRTTAGGYHAKTQFSCIALFSITFSVFLVLILKFSVFTSYIYIVFCAIFSLALIFIFSPVQASNKPLTKKTATRNRIISLIIATLFVIPAIAFVAIPNLNKRYIAEFYAGELSATLSLVIVKIKNMQDEKSLI